MLQPTLARLPLPYSNDSTELFENLRQQPYPAFLDSSGYGGNFGRFDILCAEPLWILRHQQQQTQRIDPHGNTQILQQPPFEALQQLLIEQGFNGATTDELPFCGGALGFWGYDLGKHYYPQTQTGNSTAFKFADMQIGIYPWAIIVDHQRQQTTLASQTLTAEKLKAVAKQLQQPIIDQPSAFKLNSRFLSNLDRSHYQRCFNQVIDYVHAGDCYQVNLAQRFSCSYQGDSWQAYKALRTRTGTPFSAYLTTPDGELLSLSPERFLQVSDGEVETRPIKGTRPRHSDPQQDLVFKQQLMDSDKDRAENLMIVDLLRNDLGHSCATGSIRVPELFKVESYANVHHLVSTITGQLEQPIDAVKLLQHSFPGGSITGAPKIRAMQIIDALEPDTRSAYCGSIGYIGFNGRMDTNICIRTLVASRPDSQLAEGQLYCWAGGGIVADSDCEAEYQETFDKVNNLLKGLEATFLQD